MSLNSSCFAPTTGTGPETFARAIQFFTAAQCVLREDQIDVDYVEDAARYDFIVVGGGSAGCIIANRLSEVSKWKILLIEAGPTAPFESMVPGLNRGMFRTKYDWQYYTQDDGRTGKAIKNHSIYWPRGKMLGGCSSINGLIYVRGNRKDYQRWYDAGNKDWHPNVVEECFRKAENLQDKELMGNQKLKNYYGDNGPVRITRFDSTYKNLNEKVLQSWDEMGFKTVLDLNYANLSWVSGIMTVTSYKGRRESTDRAYIRPVKSRQNLHVITNALVRRVLVDKDRKEAYGVEIERDNEIITVLASKEVIISAGAINTPQLLMLSGIGSKDHLESKNISCIVDLPAVGKYLQDHSIVPVAILGDEPNEENEAEKQFDAIKYIYNQTGYLAQNSFSDISVFYSKDKDFSYPQFQSHLSIFYKKSPAVTNYFQGMRYQDVVVDSMQNHNKNSSIYLFLFTLLHPSSMGHITLDTSYPKDHPLIQPNYFNDSRDVKTAVEGIKMLTKIVKTKYFKSINGRVGRMSYPECDKFKLDSDDYWKCIAINLRVTVYHPVGTARMGKDAKTSVVNSELKVHSIKKLRVADASVMPSHVSGNTNGPVIMIGERASSLIKRDYGIPADSADQCY